MKAKVNAHAIGALLFSLSWLLADHYRPWTSFHSEALAFFALSFLVTSTLIAKIAINIPQVSGWVILLYFLPWLHFSSGIIKFAGDALLSSLYLSGFLGAIVFGYDIANTNRQQPTSGSIGWIHALWFAALISTAIGLTQWLQLNEYLGALTVQTDMGARSSGNLGQPNQLASLLLIGIASIAYAYEQKLIGGLAINLAAAFMTGVLVLTQSRAGMVSVLVISAFLLWKQRSVRLRLSRTAVIWWVMGFIAATLLLPNLSEFLMLGDVRSLTATESVSERWLIWKQVSYAIAQAPWFGYGWNQTPTANAVGALAFPGSTTYTNAHNIVLDLMVWCGIPLGLLLTGLMAYWGFSRMRAVKQPQAILAMAALLPIAVHSLLEFPFAYAYFLISAGFFVGIVEASHVPSRSVAIKTRWLWAVLGIWAGLGGYIAYEYLQIEEDFRIVRFENLRVGATPASYEAPHVWMLSHMAAMLKAARQVPKPDMPRADLENLRKVSDRFAYGAIRFKYAQALGLNGDPAGATRQMQIIHGMYGDFFYKACKDELARLTVDKYPQLAQIRVSD